MLKKLLNEFKDFLKKMIKSRLFIIGVVIVGMFTIVINRLFILQIVNGEDYLNNFKLKIEKELLEKRFEVLKNNYREVCDEYFYNRQELKDKIERYKALFYIFLAVSIILMTFIIV